MTETACTFPGDRDEALVTYLYDDESDAAAHAVFEAHLATCVRCVDDLAALRGVRTRLARWSPPEPNFASRSQQSAANPQSTINPPPAIRNPQWWRAIPAWAQVAAALVFLGVAAGVANLDIRHDSNGLSVRTGWMKTTVAQVPAATATTPAGTASQLNVAVTREDLNALERRLRTEFHAPAAVNGTAAAQPQPARVSSDAEIVRRVRALVDESEKRQQNELALRLAEVLRDVNVQRQADLVKVDRALGLVKNDLGVEVLKNRQQMNYYIRTSQKQ